jgi:hypothetical protein
MLHTVHDCTCTVSFQERAATRSKKPKATCTYRHRHVYPPYCTVKVIDQSSIQNEKTLMHPEISNLEIFFNTQEPTRNLSRPCHGKLSSGPSIEVTSLEVDVTWKVSAETRRSFPTCIIFTRCARCVVVLLLVPFM